MNKVTRHAVFETNSSSSHSISISPDEVLTDKLAVHNGVCQIHDGEFGWGVEVFSDASTKASYCYTYARANKGTGNLLQTISERPLNMLQEVIEEQMECKVEFVSDEGYIDHQSEETCIAAFKDRDTLRRFIFSPKSILNIDHDNH